MRARLLSTVCVSRGHCLRLCAYPAASEERSRLTLLTIKGFFIARGFSLIQTKAPFQLFERNCRFVPLQRGNALQIVFAIFKILADRFPRVITLTPAGLFGERLQFLFKFGLETDAKNMFNMLNIIRYGNSRQENARCR